MRSPWLIQGYLKDANGSATLWAGGWLHTGDIAVCDGDGDGDGYFRIADRIKDVIKTGGEWISSLDLEYLILRHPDVDEAAVIGVADPKWGERSLAYIVLRDGAAITAEEVRAHLAHYVGEGLLSRYAVPEQIRLIGHLPKTSVGKLDKKALRELV